MEEWRGYWGGVWEGGDQPRGPVKVGSATRETGKQEPEAGRPSGKQQHSLLRGAGCGRMPPAQFQREQAQVGNPGFLKRLGRMPPPPTTQQTNTHNTSGLDSEVFVMKEEAQGEGAAVG